MSIAPTYRFGSGTPINSLFATQVDVDISQLAGFINGPIATAQFDKTDTNLANVTNLSATLTAGKSYGFHARLFTTSPNTGGVKAAISGTATATSIIYEGLSINAGAITQSRSTALGTAVGAVTAVTAALILIEGLIIVNQGGTLTVQFAQNAASGTSSVLVGSYFMVFQLT